MIDLDSLERQSNWNFGNAPIFYPHTIMKLIAELRAARKVVEAAKDATSECDHSEDARGYCVGHGGITRLPCEFAVLNAALAEYEALGK